MSAQVFMDAMGEINVKYVEEVLTYRCPAKHKTLPVWLKGGIAACLAAIVSLGAFFAVNAEARAAFCSWVRDVYEDQIVYRFFGEPVSEELPEYHISWIPAGYEIVDVFYNGDLYNAFYQQGDDVMSAFVFEYFFVQDNALIGFLHFDDEDYLYRNINVKGIQADFYEALLPEETNDLIWVDERANIVFSLNGFLDESAMVRIAESVVLSESTK